MAFRDVGRLTQLLRRKGRGASSLTRSSGYDNDDDDDPDLGQHFPPQDN